MFTVNKKGRVGGYGGIYMPELLTAPIQALIETWNELKADISFQNELSALLMNYAGRPTPLTKLNHFAKAIGAQNIYLKREDLLHTGAHKLNNALGQCLIAKRLGKKRVIAETGAGQHGVATAAAAAHLGLQCVVYMGANDIERQKPNVLRMNLLNATIVSVDAGEKTLKEAINAALRDWAHSYEDTFYCLGSALGPHPYPEMVANFQSIIGEETKAQCQKLDICPSHLIACVGGGSNAIGFFQAFLSDVAIKLIGVEAGGHGNSIGQHAARFKNKTKGVLHGCYSYLLQDEDGQTANTASISAGLDYPSVGPHHAALFDANRVQYVSVNDEEALQAFKLLSKTEGIIPALESAHALAHVIKLVRQEKNAKNIIVNLSGRGDKDLNQVEHLL